MTRRRKLEAKEVSWRFVLGILGIDAEVLMAAISDVSRPEHQCLSEDDIKAMARVSVIMVSLAARSLTPSGDVELSIILANMLRDLTREYANDKGMLGELWMT